MASSTSFKAGLAGVAAVLVMLLSGCADARAVTATARRWEQVHRCVDLFVARESRAPEQATQTIELARSTWKRHVQKTARNGERLRLWADRDLKRWQLKQPVYRRRMADYVRGDPSRISWAVAAAFY